MRKPTSLFSKFLLHGGIYAVARILERAAGLVLVPIYARTLRDQGYGVVALLASVTPFLVVLFGQGLPGAWFRLRHDYQGREARRRFEATIVWYLVAATMVLTVSLSAIGDWVAAAIADDLPFYPLVLLAMLTAALQVFGDLYVRRANAEERPLAVVAFTVPKTITTLSCVIIGVTVLDLGPLGKVGAESLVAGVFAMIALYRLRPAAPTNISKAILRRSLGFGLPLVPHAIATQINGMASRILIARILGLSATGVYSMGSAIADVANMVAVSFNQGFSPLFIREVRRLESSELDSQERERAAAGLARTGLLMVTAVACVSLVLTAGAREVLLILATEQFSDSYTVVAPLAAATVFRSSYFAFAQPLFANVNAVRRMPIVSFVGAGVTVAANLALLPRVGFIGAAFAIMTANAGMASLALYMGQATFRLPHSPRQWGLLLATVGAGLVGLSIADSLESLPHRLAVKTAIVGVGSWLVLASVGTSPRALLAFVQTRAGRR